MLRVQLGSHPWPLELLIGGTESGERYLQGRARTCSLDLARFWLFRGPTSCHPNTGTRDKGLIPTEGDCGTDGGRAQ